MSIAEPRDHGGGLDAAIDRFGGTRTGWLDLSTGINPLPYPVADPDRDCWTALPDRAARNALESAARRFWDVPQRAAVLAAPGASSLIARIPALHPAGAVRIDSPTYNEHAGAFRAQGWTLAESAATRVVVHPNNPDGRWWQVEGDLDLLIVDESFCDITPERSHIGLAARPGVVILKSFGKFWGLAGLRLGFAIGDPALIARLAELLGPWPVSGPALEIGTRALRDRNWADTTRTRLRADAGRLDALMTAAGAAMVGGTPLFRLYHVENAAAWQTRLARHHIWTRVFPYASDWLRLGLPHPDRWAQLENAL
ncbi:MAG: pyridoxal phosphate-dependent class II aminotransferase [Rhodobacter sp.]|nr:pyridoxal phosphate-dependent class II aminotransferase [Rhodobacter sp.]